MNKLYRIVVHQTAKVLSDHDDKIQSPTGEYFFEACDKEAALDQFHFSIPIGCLDDFSIEVQEVPWEVIQ